MSVRWLLDPSCHHAEGIRFCEQIGMFMATLTDADAIHRGRNTLYRCRVLGYPAVIKSFRKPAWWRNLVGKRASKAFRSFEIAQRLQAFGVATPQPLAAIEVRAGKRLAASYYICADQQHRATMRDVHEPDFPDRERVLEGFGRFAADLHDHGILHRDLTSGNILLVPGRGVVGFSLVDLNRVRIGRVSRSAGIRNLLQTGFEGEDALALLRGYCAARKPTLELAGAARSYALWGGWHRLRWFAKNKTRKARRKVGL